MIIPNPEEQFYDAEFQNMEIQPLTVFVAPHDRISELLGADGEPMLVGYPKPKLGFDLRAKTEAGK